MFIGICTKVSYNKMDTHGPAHMKALHSSEFQRIFYYEKTGVGERRKYIGIIGN
jgi:hypothetical protein